MVERLLKNNGFYLKTKKPTHVQETRKEPSLRALTNNQFTQQLQDFWSVNMCSNTHVSFPIADPELTEEQQAAGNYKAKSLQSIPKHIFIRWECATTWLTELRTMKTNRRAVNSGAIIQSFQPYNAVLYLRLKLHTLEQRVPSSESFAKHCPTTCTAACFNTSDWN